MADERIDLTEVANDFRFRVPREGGIEVTDGRTWEERNERGTWEERNEMGDSRGARFRRVVRSFVMGNLGGG